MGTEWQDYVALQKERPHMFEYSDLIDIVTDETIVREYEEKTGKKIGIVYKSPYHYMVVDLIQKQDGTYYTYERLLPAVEKGAVVVMVNCGGRFVLMRQFRHAIREYEYSFPRGFGEEGLTAEENARKEVQEELGVTVDQVEFLGNVVSDSGAMAGTVAIYYATAASFEVKRGYEGIEDVIALTPEEFEQWIIDGKVLDGFTLTAYCYYKTRHQ